MQAHRFDSKQLNRNVQVLEALDGDALRVGECYLGGGTALALTFGEFRNVAGLDIVCRSMAGHRNLRDIVQNDLGALLKTPLKHLRGIRKDQSTLFTVVEIDGAPVKVRFMREDRFALDESMDTVCGGVPVLSREDQFTHKLLANADRGRNPASQSKDIIDILMMSRVVGGIPSAAWQKALVAYGDLVKQRYDAALALLSDSVHLQHCANALCLSAASLNRVVLFLDFDGVTHPEPCFQDNVMCRLPPIEEVLRDFPAVEIVISSTWRDHHTLTELKDMFSDDIKDRVVGVTPSIKNPSSMWLPGSAPAHEREREIETWMKANRPRGTPWLAIDDRPDWFRDHCPDLLVTDSRIGFHPRQQQTLRLMLKLREEEL